MIYNGYVVGTVCIGVEFLLRFHNTAFDVIFVQVILVC